MKAVILAGGRGTRLSRVTHNKMPKPMAELAGRPVLEHIVLLLAHHGFRDICCTLACMPEMIRNHFGSGRSFGVHMEYRVETQPLGTAGAVKNCRDFYGDEPFLIISGDAACDFDLGFLYKTHCRAKNAVTMALFPHDAPTPYGLVLTDRENRVRQFLEKPRWEQVVTDLVNTGIYIMNPSAMAQVPENTPCDFGKDLFPRLLAQGKNSWGFPCRDTGGILGIRPPITGPIWTRRRADCSCSPSLQSPCRLQQKLPR